MRHLCIVLVALFSGSLLAADNERATYIREHYAKYEYRIPMRDGKRLFTSVYVPYDQSKKYPFLMVRTPYRVIPYGADKYKAALGPDASYEKEKFIFVFQDVRGKFMSEGNYENMRPQDAYTKSKDAVDDATDAYDTIEWLVKNIQGNNGKLGQWGVSYPGYYASVSAINSHPALKAVSPQAPIADWFFDDFHRNGAFILAMAYSFLPNFDLPREGQYRHWPKPIAEWETPDGYAFYKELGPLSNINKLYLKEKIPFWNSLTEHPNYDQYWQDRNILPHLKEIKPAVLVVGGWFDTEDLYGPLATYQTMHKESTGKNVHFVMGPWQHGGWHKTGDSLGDADFGFNTSKWYRKRIELPFFKYHLKGGDDPGLSKVMMFETGANRWREFKEWPVENSEKLNIYLNAEEHLSFDSPDGDEGSTEYISDPNKPVPYTKEILNGWGKNYMAEDQRFTAWRPDVLSFTSEPLTKDITLAGKLEVDFWVSTSQSDADWVVKIVDILPGKKMDDNKIDWSKGNQHLLVRWGVLRGRFRNSMSAPVPFKPNEPTHIVFDLYDILHNFQRDHKIMIQVQSTMFPFIDLNPQKYVDNIFKAKKEDFVKAKHTVYHNAKHPSVIRASVLSP